MLYAQQLVEERLRGAAKRLSQEELQSVVDTVEAEKEAGGGGQAAQS